MLYNEKRIFILQLSSNLTASSARILFGSRLPFSRHKVLLQGGVWELLTQDKSTFVMVLCDSILLKEIEDALQFVIKSEDVTNKLVNSDDYIFQPSQIQQFNYLKLEKAYTECYLKEATVEFARARIKGLRNKSRSIDHKVLFNHGKEI
jgi:hypothetical protein